MAIYDVHNNRKMEKEILCRGVRMNTFEELRAAHLVNIEDITIILQAQKKPRGRKSHDVWPTKLKIP